MNAKRREKIVMGLLLAAMLLLMAEAADGPGWLWRQGLITGAALVLLGLAVKMQPKNHKP